MFQKETILFISEFINYSAIYIMVFYVSGVKNIFSIYFHSVRVIQISFFHYLRIIHGHDAFEKRNKTVWRVIKNTFLYINLIKCKNAELKMKSMKTRKRV